MNKQRRKPGKYKLLRTYTYVPKMDGDIPDQEIWRIIFPEIWKNRLEQLETYCQSTNNYRQKRYIRLPIDSLASVQLLVFPSLLTRGFKYHTKLKQLRLLSTEDMHEQKETLVDVTRAWINCVYTRKIRRGAKDSATIVSYLRDTLQILSPDHLEQERYRVNLLHPELDAEREKQILEPLYYSAVPAWIISQLNGKSFEIDNHHFTMCRTKTPNGNLELMSWPPQQGIYGKKPGYFSLVLNFQIHTIPQVDQYVIFPKWSVRRWVNQSLFIERKNKQKWLVLSGQNSTVYLRTRIPWLGVTTNSGDITTAYLKGSRDIALWADDIQDILVDQLGA